MTRMRRGFSLLELLVLLPLLGVVGVIAGSMFPALVRDVPKLQQVVYQNDRISTVLRCIRRDVDAAEALPDHYAGKTAGPKRLLIKLDHAVICYEIREDEIVKEQLGPDAASPPRRIECWTLPDAKVHFERWDRSGAAFAVEIHTAVEFTTHGHTLDKLANTHVFYLSAVPRFREKT